MFQCTKIQPSISKRSKIWSTHFKLTSIPFCHAFHTSKQDRTNVFSRNPINFLNDISFTCDDCLLCYRWQHLRSRMCEPPDKSDRTINSLCVCTGYDRRDHDTSLICFWADFSIIFPSHFWRPFWHPFVPTGKWRWSPHELWYRVASWAICI